MTPDEAYAPLAFALRDFEPPCNGHEVFMSPDTTELEQAVCASICAGCPVIEMCDAYATKSQVDLGFWGGLNRNPQRRRTNSSTTADRTVSGTDEREEP